MEDESGKTIFEETEMNELWINRLIRNNSGLSSKNFFLVTVTIIGSILLLVPAFTLIIEIIFTHTIATDITGFAAYIAAVGSLFASVGLTKAYSEKFEMRNSETNGEEDT